MGHIFTIITMECTSDDIRHESHKILILVEWDRFVFGPLSRMCMLVVSGGPIVVLIKEEAMRNLVLIDH